MVEQPHAENVDGPFYVCEGCCTACDVPFHETPEMFAYDDRNHCYVKRQPENKSELDRMIRTVLSSELECIRYRGNDKDVLRRFAETGNAYLSDVPVAGVSRVSRDHVTFDAVDPVDQLLSEKDLAMEFQRHLRKSEYVDHKFTPLLSDGEKTSFTYAWYEDNYHRVDFHFLGSPAGRWLGVSSAAWGLHDWLVAEKRFCNIRWFTKEGWSSSREWQETPW